MARVGILTEQDHRKFTDWLSGLLVGLKTGKISFDDVQGPLGQVVGAIDTGKIGEVRKWIEGSNADPSHTLTMKSPAEVVPLPSEDQKRQASELIKEIEEHFKKNHEEYFIENIYGMNPRYSEEVWREVVVTAQQNGWDASMQGAQITIKLPSR